jgi:hygromycin-B 7''-O-kinase
MNSIFPPIDSFEEYEKHKLKTEVLENAAREIIHKHHLPAGQLSLFHEGTNIVFAYGNDRVIKIFPPLHQNQFKSEVMTLHHLQGRLSVTIPTIEYQGEIKGWLYIVMNRLPGTLLETLWEKLDHPNKVIIIRELGSLIREVHSIPTQGLEKIDCHWAEFIEKQIKNCVAHHRFIQLSENLLQQIPHYLESIQPSLFQIKKRVILTGEYTPMNFLVKQISGNWHIDGLIDFGDAMLGLPEYDLLGPGAFLIQGDKALLREFLASYGYLSDEMTATLSHKLTALMLLHRYSNLNTQLRINNWQNEIKDIKFLENFVWGFNALS